jgi:hypothetical protein
MMNEEFVPLGQQSPAEIARKLHEIDDDEAALVYEAYAESSRLGLESVFNPPRSYLNTQHQYGFIPRFEPGSGRFHNIIAASNAPAGLELKNKRINIKLDYLRVHEYPRPFINLGHNIHTILFTFEARNQIPGGSEAVAFNQTYRAKSGQDVAVTGNPIFIGLSVGSDGVVFSCKTVNVGNSSDEKLVDAINSEAATLGLNLLTTAQPALTPFIGVARGLCLSLASRSKNAGVQKIDLGLDFETGATGARLAVGSYIVVQVERANEIVWSDWSFDSETGTIVRTNLAEGEESYVLPYNAIVFRVSPYEGHSS